MDDRNTVVTFEPAEIHALLEFWRWIKESKDWPRDPALAKAFDRIHNAEVNQRLQRLRDRLQSSETEEPTTE